MVRVQSPSALPAYTTALGSLYGGTIEEILSSPIAASLRGKVQLIFTSPPFPLNTKKRYGNLQGEEYLSWLAGLAPALRKLLRADGSIVLEIGNAWEAGSPTMSTLPLRALLSFAEAADLRVCQQFIAHNPARLPSPVQWVNVERIRLKDTFAHIWWMSPTDRPKADNRKVLTPYSARMAALLRNGTYNSGKRPSEHVIGESSFLTDNGGAIPGNVITVSNTGSAGDYLRYCREHGLTPHPARMPSQIAEFFIRLLTDAGDLVVDPFAGSNTTGAAAESLARRWLSVEPSDEYIEGSKGRFTSTQVASAPPR